ncbi:hypothetical protein IAU60_002337 [Kwoniella sp. DSM 27419]
MSGITYKGPINPNPKDDEARIVIYGYVPSLALGIVGIITFILIGGVHAYWLFTKRWTAKGRRWFHGLILIGTLMEAGGYAARLASHRRPFVVSSFVAQYFLIVVAPVLFSAAIYLSLSLAARGYVGGERLLVLRPKLVLAFFVSADVICTIVQVAGAALIGTSESARVRGEPSRVSPEQANNILIAGLAVQCFSFTCFLVILSIAITRVARSTYVKSTGIEVAAHQTLRKFLWVILATALLILLRTTFRLAESAQGFFGFASTHESLFGTLEYLPVILTLMLWAAAPPAKFLPSTRGLNRVRGSTSNESAAGLKEQRGSTVV